MKYNVKYNIIILFKITRVANVTLRIFNTLLFYILQIRLVLVDSDIKPTEYLFIPIQFLRCDSLNSTR
jgi:hypothetical protein